MTHATSGTDDLALLDDLARAHTQLVAQIGRRIVGQHAVVDNIVAALLSGGHALLVGVRGWRKRCSCARWPRRSTSPSRACSSRRI